jgi:predicted DNA-binding protein
MSITAPTQYWYRKWYRFSMGMNLRLPDELASRLRSLATQTGKSQQVLVREAIEMYLRDYQLAAYPPEIRHAITPASRLLSEILSELPAPTGWSGEKSIVETIREMREDRTS